MSQDTDIRKLIQLIPPARALQEQLEKSLELELYTGIGNMALKNFSGLVESVQQVTNDPYLQSLTPELPPESDDRQKVGFVLLACSQLVAYMEGQVGMGSSKKTESGTKYGDNINVKIGDSDGMKQLGEMLSKVFGEGGVVSNIGERIKTEVERAVNEGGAVHNASEKVREKAEQVVKETKKATEQGPDLDADQTIHSRGT